MNIDNVIIRWLGTTSYLDSWQAMQDFTNQRQTDTPDELWLLEHQPVFTQGQSGKPEHVLRTSTIPIVQTDRGGQVTYHGPGQLMVYTLVDLKRKKFTIRDMVCSLEKSIIDLLAFHGIESHAKREAPGVYVAGKKICSIGLRVRRGCVYHGIALNVNMDLAPFSDINPCGFNNLLMTQLQLFNINATPYETGMQLIRFLMPRLGYNFCKFFDVI